MGWEPNPTHTDHLIGLETAYNKCGWKVVLNTATGVGAHSKIGKVRICFFFGFTYIEPSLT